MIKWDFAEMRFSPEHLSDRSGHFRVQRRCVRIDEERVVKQQTCKKSAIVFAMQCSTVTLCSIMDV